MKAFFYLLVLMISISFASCASTGNKDKDPERGSKGGVCYKTLTCNSGLICVDMICQEDPCYEVSCDSWERCEEGACVLQTNRCESVADCEGSAICDVHHYCIDENNPCENQTCSGHGTCLVDTNTNNPVCNCDNGYNNKTNPLECEEDAVVNPCDSVTCKTWETCNETNGNCDLNPNRCGSNGDCLGDKVCDENHNCVDPANPCEGISCNNHGSCGVVGGVAKCVCDTEDGYFPDAGGLNCLNPCVGHENCGGFGTCKSTSSDEAVCECLNGYKPQGLKCVVNNLCEGVQCSEWKPCDANTGSCVLATGRCDSNSDCSGGQVCDSDHNCINEVNPCEGQTCSNHGSCIVDGSGNAKCDCDVNNGYYPSGLNCINPCEGETCSNHGYCVPSNATTAVCNCEPGYNAVGLNCVQDDPCANITCSDAWKQCVDGTCELIPGKCDDASDCASDKPACQNNTCVNLCDSLNCGAHGTCTSDATEAICVCNDNAYTGDLCDECSAGHQDQDNNGTCEPYTVWCKIQHPASINTEKDSVVPVFARVYVAGLTEASTESALIKTELGYTIEDAVTLPINDADYIWLPANYNSSCSDCGNNDEYMANFPTDTAGSFKYIYRVSVDNGVNWLHCDTDGVGGVNDDPFDTSLVGQAEVTEGGGNTGGTLFFSEIVDHKETPNAKYVEIYNPAGEAVSLVDWTIERYANGANDAGTGVKTFTEGNIPANTAFVIAYNETEFTTAFNNTTPDLVLSQVISGNGDDVYVLKNPAGEIVDIYGVIGVDGSGKDWEYTDSVAKRNTNISTGNATWTASEWTITAGSTDATPKQR